jgi:hypothetical protein
MDQHLCRYCGFRLTEPVKRCQKCNSWLSFRSYIAYPVTIVQLAAAVATVTLAFFSANYAYRQAVDANVARKAAELNLEKSVSVQQEVARTKTDITIVAENVTKMALLLVDGSGRFDGIPQEYRDRIKMYKQALSPYLSPQVDAEVGAIIRQLNDRVRQESGARTH